MTQPKNSLSRSLLREPFVHFLLIGAALFLLYGLLNSGPGSGEGQIVVSAGRIEQLANIFGKTWQRPPTRQELEGLIEEFVLEEAYYRQAVEMGLDRDDTVIRRRLRQKLEFLTDDSAALDQPGDEELEGYLREHSNDFREPSVYSFQQAFIDPDRHPNDPGAYARSQLQALRSGETDVGDPTLLPDSFKESSSGIVDRTFGNGFSLELDKLEVGGWEGPVRSAYGLHLVRLDSRIPGSLPNLDKIRPVVEREWGNAKRTALRDAANAALREQYEVVVEWPFSDETSQANAP